MKTIAGALSVCVFALALMAGAVRAQTFTATMTGTVSDPQGSSVPNVKVVATNQGTKLEYSAQTSDSGVYTIPFLPAGSYILTVEASGFKKLISNEIKLEVNQTARADLQLTVGGVNEVVNVSDVAAILQTENVTVGNVITGNTTVNLPLNGRNFQQLTLLVPGAVSPNPGGFNNSSLQNGQGRPYVNGNREQGNAFLLDGVSVDETIDNRIGYKPNVDAIAEFRVETSNSSSEFGNVTGATVNATLKSGTNEFHGNVYDFLRNDALDANIWANNRNGAAKQKLRQNIFGGTFGGPVIKNKLFFFTDYQGTIRRTGGGTSVNVAPAEWRTGNLSSLLTLATPIYVRDPLLTGACNAADRTACFPGNIIPANRIVNPAARALFGNTALYPLPSRIDPTTKVGIFNTTTADKLDGHQFDVKIDARATDRDNLSVRYSFGNFEERGDRGSLPVVTIGKSFNRPQNVAINWTHTFSPSIVNEARVGLNRATFITDTVDWAGIGNANASFGIPGTQAVPGLSLLVLGNGLANVGNRVTSEDSVSNTFVYSDNLSISRGRHFFKMGGQLQHYQQNRFYAGNNGLVGGFTYDGKYSGAAVADFLLDLLSNKSIGNSGGLNPGSWGHRQNRLGLFFQDDFKIRNNLTLNLGMRWEYTSPLVEVKNRQANYELFTGRQLLAGQNGNSRSLYEPFKKGFEPRVGFAWTPSYFKNRLVVRGGYGITQFMEGTGANLRLPLSPPFFSEADVTFDPTRPGSITTGFTDVIVRDRAFGLLRVWDPNLRPQFTQQYNLSFEYEMTKSLSVTAAYVGNNATHLVAPTDFNQPLPGPSGVAPSAWAPVQQRRPLFLFSDLDDVTQISGTASWGVSRYNGLQLSARQRLAKGAEFLASYTLSKTLTDNLGYYGSAGVSAQSAYSYNQYDHRLNYGLAFFDATHNFTWSGTYELPFGKGRSFGGDLHPAVNAVLGGWNLNSIVQFRTGFPLTITTGLDRTFQNPRGGQKPNLIGDPVPTDQNINKWINAAAFAPAPDGVFGNSPVGVMRSPGYANWDFGVGKKFYIKEHNFIDFRAEFFNFTNHPSFSPPARDFNAPNTFGVITSTVSPPRIMEFALKYHF